jgi:hypothetical protein
MTTRTRPTREGPILLDVRNRSLRCLATVSLSNDAGAASTHSALIAAQVAGVTTSEYLKARLLLQARIHPDCSEGEL